MLLWRSRLLANYNKGRASGHWRRLSDTSRAMTTDSLIAETIADPRWFPLYFDARTGNLHFAFVPAEVHRELAFLKDLKPAASEIRIIPRAAIAQYPVQRAPLHLILHSGLGGSTLVARALAQPEVAVALQEPPILTDVILSGRDPSSGAALLAEVTRLLARPFSPGEAVVCKLSGIGNGMAQAIAAMDERSQLLCLQNPLDQLLSAFAARGASGRMAGRQLAIGIRNSGRFAFPMSDAELLNHTDFQLAAFAWLSIQKMMIDAANALGATRVASVTSDKLMRDAPATLAAIAAHFRLKCDVDLWAASGTFTRHAKSGEPFDQKARAERLAESLRVHAQEIEPVIGWAKEVAEKAGIPWELPSPLLEQTA